MLGGLSRGVREEEKVLVSLLGQLIIPILIPFKCNWERECGFPE